jgi:drug/metabolite transporter (DMT)-like permease
MLQKLPPEINSLCLRQPYCGGVVGCIIFGEVLTVAIGIGGLITLSGLYMVNHSIKKNKRILAGNKV